jgi:hypothetical protein
MQKRRRWYFRIVATSGRLVRRSNAYCLNLRPGECWRRLCAPMQISRHFRVQRAMDLHAARQKSLLKAN